MPLARRWALPWNNPHLAPGMRLGRYRIVRRLAVGGMAEIFLARVEGMRGFEKLVVIKRLLPHHVSNQNLVRMFLDEARLMATLNHANITQVHDVGEARGSYFFAMEYVHGEDVRTILRASAQKGEPLPIEISVGIIADAAAGLHHAHEKRGSDGAPLEIVHRDVSPSNVLVSFEGAVKLTDFGVAKWALQASHTRQGTLKGKCAYMAPEQCRGEAVDARSDVFALGILLYELSTGTRLFQGASDFQILTQIVEGSIVRPSDRRPEYPAALEPIVMRALERPRERRYADARELQMALESFAFDYHLAATPIVRAQFMEQLFARKLGAWRAAEGAGRSLGQHLASLPDREIIGFEDATDVGEGDSNRDAGSGFGETPAGGTLVTGAGAVAVIPAVAAAPATPRRRQAWLWRAAAAIGVALLGVALVIAQRLTPAPRHGAPAPTAAVTAPATPVPAAPAPSTTALAANPRGLAAEPGVVPAAAAEPGVVPAAAAEPGVVPAAEPVAAPAAAEPAVARAGGGGANAEPFSARPREPSAAPPISAAPLAGSDRRESLLAPAPPGAPSAPPRSRPGTPLAARPSLATAPRTKSTSDRATSPAAAAISDGAKQATPPPAAKPAVSTPPSPPTPPANPAPQNATQDRERVRIWDPDSVLLPK